MPFKGERVLAFLGHQPLSSSVTLEKTNQPNFVNYEQTVIVTELTSGSECELVSSVHLRSTEGLTVEIRASHAGRLPSVWTWMRTGLVRSPDARNKSSPLPASLVLEAGKAQFERENPSKPRCVTRTDDSEVVSIRKLFENNPAVSTGLPETLLLLPKTHRCQSAERSELALLSASGEAQIRPAVPAELIALTAHSRHGPVGSTHSNNSPLLTRIGNTIDSRSASSPPPLPSSLRRAPPTCCRKSWLTGAAANELSRWEIWTQSEALIGGLSRPGTERESPCSLWGPWTTESTGGKHRTNLREQQH